MSLNGLAAQQGFEIYSDLVATSGRRAENDTAAAATEGETQTRTWLRCGPPSHALPGD